MGWRCRLGSDPGDGTGDDDRSGGGTGNDYDDGPSDGCDDGGVGGGSGGYSLGERTLESRGGYGSGQATSAEDNGGRRCPWGHTPRAPPYAKNPTENVRSSYFSTGGSKPIMTSSNFS